jgi:hypothetical protein
MQVNSRKTGSATCDHPVVMQEMGHTDPGLAPEVYAQSMRRGPDEQAAVRALADGADRSVGQEASFDLVSDRIAV